MQNESNPFLCHPASLGSRKLALCFFSHLFYSQFGILKISFNNIVLNSVSRHDDVILEYKDIMTQGRHAVLIGMRYTRAVLRYTSGFLASLIDK